MHTLRLRGDQWRATTLATLLTAAVIAVVLLEIGALTADTASPGDAGRVMSAPTDQQLVRPDTGPIWLTKPLAAPLDGLRTIR